MKFDNGRAKARSLVEPGVLTLGQGKVGKSSNPVPPAVVRQKDDVRRMAATNPPQPGYAKGGKVKMAMGGEMAGVAAGLRPPRMARAMMPAKAPMRTGKPNFAERMAKPGGLKKGGKVHDDEAQDKALIKKMMNAAEKKEGEKPAFKRGGAVCKMADGGAPRSREERDESADKEAADAASLPGGIGILLSLSPRAKGMVNDRAAKASEAERAAMMGPGVRKMAAGGVAKIRHGQATKDGAPKAPKR